MSNRQHWDMHTCCMPAMKVEGEAQHDGANLSVYSAKNEGSSAYVLINLNCIGFDANSKLSPDRARELADSLRAAADAADAAARGEFTAPPKANS